MKPILPSGFPFVKKKSLKKKFFLKKKKKKCLQLTCASKIFKMVCKKFLKINGSRDILTFDDFTAPKFPLHNKIIHKTRTTKNQQNSTHRLGDKYFTNHLVKFLQDRIRIKP